MATVQHDIKEIKHKLDFESNNLVKRHKLETQLKRLHKILDKYERLRIFRLEPEQKSTMVQVHPLSFGCAQIKFIVIMTQFLLNLSNVTIGHKLQGMSIDDMIIAAFPNKKLRALFKN